MEGEIATRFQKKACAYFLEQNARKQADAEAKEREAIERELRPIFDILDGDWGIAAEGYMLPEAFPAKLAAQGAKIVLTQTPPILCLTLPDGVKIMYSRNLKPPIRIE